MDWKISIVNLISVFLMGTIFTSVAKKLSEKNHGRAVQNAAFNNIGLL